MPSLLWTDAYLFCEIPEIPHWFLTVWPHILFHVTNIKNWEDTPLRMENVKVVFFIANLILLVDYYTIFSNFTHGLWSNNYLSRIYWGEYEINILSSSQYVQQYLRSIYPKTERWIIASVARATLKVNVRLKFIQKSCRLYFIYAFHVFGVILLCIFIYII